jgi:hypothetical protein
MPRFATAIVRSPMQVAPCQPNISIREAESPLQIVPKLPAAAFVAGAS